jgi:hypothetical protein
MERGDFYASTGVSLKDYHADVNEISIQIEERQSFKYTTTFIGEGGRILATSQGPKVQYRFTKAEKYVRARVTDSMGYVAWLQPVFVAKPQESSGK